MLYVVKKNKPREREFEPKFAVVDQAKEIVGLFRRHVGAERAAEAYNVLFPWNNYKVIDIEEVWS